MILEFGSIDEDHFSIRYQVANFVHKTIEVQSIITR